MALVKTILFVDGENLTLRYQAMLEELNRMEGAALPTCALRGVELAMYGTVYGSALPRRVFARAPARRPAGVAPSS